MQAIVLDRYDVRENDQIISVYTKDHGRQDALARGIKKITSKNSANLQTAAFVDIEIIQGKEVSHLTKAHPIAFYPSVRNHPWKSMAVLFALTSLKRVTQVGEADPRIFTLLKNWLSFIDQYNGTTFITLVDAYMLHVFSYLGFTPNMNECVVCEKPKHAILKQEIEDGEKGKPGLYFAGGGMVCGNCKQTKRSLGERVYNCGLKELSFFERLLNHDWNVVAQIDCNEKDRALVHALVYEYILYHHEKKIADWGVWCV